MAEQSIDPVVADGLRIVTQFVPGIAGAVLALAFLERLTPRGRLVAVVVGLAAAIFLAPALSALADLVWPGRLPQQVDGGIKFITGLCAMGCLPPLLAWMRSVAGNPLALLSLLKVQIGTVPGPPPASPPPSGSRDVGVE